MTAGRLAFKAAAVLAVLSLPLIVSALFQHGAARVAWTVAVAAFLLLG